MALPYWNTNAGSLGIYPAQDLLHIQLNGGSTMSVVLTYTLLNGKLPNGVSLNNETGVISGYPQAVDAQTTYTFTVRLTDSLNNLRDRTFSIDVFDRTGVKITTPPSTIINTYDSKYVDYQIQYVNPASASNLIFSLTAGTLPPGLILTSDGRIMGWPKPPTINNSTPTTTLYKFAVALTSDSGRDSVVLSINVRNWLLGNSSNTRIPAILNNTPLEVSDANVDPYTSYYITTNSLPDAVSDEKYTFKVIGYDFDSNDIQYIFSNMPPGLSGNSQTGWVTGTPTVAYGTLSIFYFTVSVTKKSTPSISSLPIRYSLVINNNVTRDITWTTPSNLGTLNNGDISELTVVASSVNTLQYNIVDGKLPPNVILSSNGRLIGRIPFQPTSTLLPVGTTTTFTFTVSAFNPLAPLDSVNCTFTLNVYQKYGHPYETVYLKAYPDIASKKILNTFLTDETLIPTEYLYRPEDTNFGRATDVRIAHLFGMYSSDYDTYESAMTTNHYTKRIVLGSPQTAITKDDNDNIIYEVVYCPVVDDLSNQNGQSVPQEITWKKLIQLYDNNWVTSNSDDNTSEDSAYTSNTPHIIQNVYPNSLVNMRKQVTSVLSQYTDQSLLPAWMTSQQPNGDTLGYIPVWVSCYTLPGYSSAIAANIAANWPHTFNEIDFQIDRYYIDKSGTYNWNTRLKTPTWISLPSAFPQPKVFGAYDISVLFPQETIIPNLTT